MTRRTVQAIDRDRNRELAFPKVRLDVQTHRLALELGRGESIAALLRRAVRDLAQRQGRECGRAAEGAEQRECSNGASAVALDGRVRDEQPTPGDAQ